MWGHHTSVSTARDDSNQGGNLTTKKMPQWLKAANEELAYHLARRRAGKAIKGGTQHKVFDGKKYREVKFFYLKSDAQSMAKRLKEEGNLARVVGKRGEGYMVYTKGDYEP